MLNLNENCEVLDESYDYKALSINLFTFFLILEQFITVVSQDLTLLKLHMMNFRKISRSYNIAATQPNLSLF